jgi:hypothetical protein
LSVLKFEKVRVLSSLNFFVEEQTMPTTKSDLKALTGKFLIFSRPGWWKISCVEPGCDREYRLEKRPDLHPGNLLHLLNHAASHNLSKSEKEEIRNEQGLKLRRVNAVLNSWMRSQL